ncbi:MAG: hypothetical protein ACYDBT_09855 [Desulfobulbaceae bacterium]
MSNIKRKRYSAEFKTKVALEAAIKGGRGLYQEDCLVKCSISAVKIMSGFCSE